MTREEAIHIIENLKPTNTKSSFDAYVVGKALTMAIEALEQEPCSDVISRQDAIDSLKAYFSDENMTETEYGAYWHHKHVIDVLMKLPPVNSQEPKTGHWIEKDGFDGDTYYDCSLCGESWTTIEGTPWNNGMKFCPNCGARMESEEMK